MSMERSIVSSSGTPAYPPDDSSACAQHEELLRQIHYLQVLLERERRRSARLEALAEHDFLTGLANRRGFTKLLKQALAHRRRYGCPMSLACFDLDGFKAVNDNHGHGVGDEVLCRVARKLTEWVRASDIVGRLGGDEFAVVFRNVRASDILPRVAALEREIAWLGRDLRGLSLGISVGVTELRDADAVAEALDRADYLMYCSKAEAGPGHIVRVSSKGA